MKRQLYRLLDLRDGGSTHTEYLVLELHTKENLNDARTDSDDGH